MALSEIDSSLRYGDYNPDPCTFKVLVQAVPMWKIRSIARFKRSAFTKKVKVLRDQEAAARAEVLRVQEEEKQAVATKHTAETAPPVPSTLGLGRSRKSKAAAAAAASVPVQEAAKPVPITMLPEPTVGLVRKDSTQWCQTREEFKHTTDSLNANMQICKHQMSALERVRANMVWLLEKATLFETQKNHSEAAVSSTHHHPKKRRKL